MEGKFTHYLITRFNVPVKNWETDKAGNKVLDPRWMEHRLDLFRNYCAPTVRNQSCSGFTWLIYCGTQTDSTDLEHIKSAIVSMDQAQIRLVIDFDELLKDLRQTLAQVSTPYMITSRLDNDDGLGPDFIGNVQMHFRPQHNLILNLSKGILYDAYRKVMTEIRSSPRNHYASLIELVTANTLPLTVLGYPHGIPPEGTEILDLPIRYSWLKVIHARNMASKTNGWPLFNNRIAEHFQLSRKLFPISIPATLTFMVTRSLSRLKRKWLTRNSSTTA